MCKQRKKSLAAVTAAVLMGAVCLPAWSMSGMNDAAVFAETVESPKTENGLTYQIRDGEVVITRYDNSVETLEIPAELDGLPVTTIQSQAFLFCSNLKEVYIPDSVTSIERNAFDSCIGLLSVRLSNHLTEIAPHTFETCTKLKSIIIPEGVTTIGERAFYYCYALETIQFPDSLTTIVA